MTRAIITPTYSGHFKYIATYLKSFAEFLTDKDFPLYFIISHTEDKLFQPIIAPYTAQLNINVVFIEDIFRKYNLPESPQKILKKYGRLSFQTLKKLYGALYINADEFLLLDSESLLIKPTVMKNKFDSYFKHPFFFTSKVTARPQDYTHHFTYNYIKTVADILGNKPEYWLVESYNWFYELKILQDLINDHGTPLEIVRQAKLTGKFPDLEGVLECLLYYQYIINHNERYGYDIVCLEEALPHYLGASAAAFHQTFNQSALNISGKFEMFTAFLNSDNVNGFINFIRRYPCSVIRMEHGNYEAQKKLLAACNISVLASNQDHYFNYSHITDQPDYVSDIIVTPTYTGHFKHIKKYLESFKTYATDKKDFCICLTINRSDYFKLQKVLTTYQTVLPLKVLFFEDILERFGITESPDYLLQQYGKFSFQALKKLYTMLYLGNPHRFLILDSESMLIRPTAVSELFADYFAHPYIAYSEIATRQKTDNVIQDVLCNIDYILQCGTRKWTLENFVWFYDSQILADMVNEHGAPLEMLQMLIVPNTTPPNLFEILLYHAYILKHPRRYRYKAINVNKELTHYLPLPQLNAYERKFYQKCGGGAGLIEHAMVFLTSENCENMAHLFKNNHFNIIRCENTSPKTYLPQRKFLEIAAPNILACSQNHIWGIRHTLPNIILCRCKLKKPLQKLQKHLNNLFKPICLLCRWSLELPLAVLRFLQIFGNLIIYPLQIIHTDIHTKTH